MALKIVFMGTPDFAVPTLAALARTHEVLAVYTQPPRPAGRRGLSLTRSPVHALADSLALAVRTPVSLRGQAEQDAFDALGADVAIVVAYGLLLPTPILEAPRLGCFNGHASLLPRWRGAAPIQRAIVEGDRETGLTIMKMDEGLDTGPVGPREAVAIGPCMTAGELHDRLSMVCAELMLRSLSLLERGDLRLVPQDSEGVTYAHKIGKQETRIDWSCPAGKVHDRIRGFSPTPGAWCIMELGGRSERVKLLHSKPVMDSGPAGMVLDDRLTIACGQGAVRLSRLQRAGGRALSAEEFLHGARLRPGTRLE